MTDSAPPRHEALRALAADPRAQAAAQATAGPPPADVTAWLADLTSLIGVPFAYLVPHPGMLPPESVRFFVVDPNWTAALIDGTLSISATTAPAAAAMAVLRPVAIHTAHRDAAARAQSAKSGPPQEPSAAATGPPVYSGFLLRSAAVADWPGVQIRAYADSAAVTTALPAIRLERLAPTILLGLFSGLVQHVEFTEPAQHLHFGVNSATDLTLSVRRVDQNQAGVQPPGDPEVRAAVRADPARVVLDIDGTVSAIANALASVYQPQPPPPLGPAGFSLQLMQATPSQAFQSDTAAPGPAAPNSGPGK
jgi:hypothetical protein